jgi:hypothetical protein
MTWQEVVAALRCSGHWVDGEDDWCGLILDLGGGRRQRMTVKRGGDGVSVVLAAQVSAERHILALEALRYNHLAEQWALGLEQGVYVLGRALSLTTLALADLAIVLAALASEATRIQRRQVGAAWSDAEMALCLHTFAHWSG